jgi:hypothetical protein
MALGTLMSPNERAAFLIAPPLAPVVWTTVLVYPYFQGDFWGGVFVVAVFGVPIAYLVALFLGLPLYILAKHRGWANFLSISIGGTAIGLVPTLFMLMPPYGRLETARDWRVGGAFALAGFIVGAIFWCIARYWPYNNSFKPKPLRGSA